MKIKTNFAKIPARVLSDITQYLVNNNKAVDDLAALRIIEKTSAEELFDWYLVWNGIINYTDTIKEALDALRKASNEVEDKMICAFNNERYEIKICRNEYGYQLSANDKETDILMSSVHLPALKKVFSDSVADILAGKIPSEFKMEE